MARRMVPARGAGMAAVDAAALDPREVAALQAEILRARLAEREAVAAAKEAEAALCKCLRKEMEKKSMHHGCGCESRKY